MTLPSAKGAYVLIVEVTEPQGITIGRTPLQVAPGRYAYCGSAYGPGGIAARAGRHLKVGKAVRWHIDRLTEGGRVVGLLARPGGSECGLRTALLSLDGTAVAAPGFGSSDCRRCESHLVALPAGLAAGEAARVCGAQVCLDRAG